MHAINKLIFRRARSASSLISLEENKALANEAWMRTRVSWCELEVCIMISINLHRS